MTKNTTIFAMFKFNTARLPIFCRHFLCLNFRLKVLLHTAQGRETEMFTEFSY